MFLFEFEKLEKQLFFDSSILYGNILILPTSEGKTRGMRQGFRE